MFHHPKHTRMKPFPHFSSLVRVLFISRIMAQIAIQEALEKEKAAAAAQAAELKRQAEETEKRVREEEEKARKEREERDQYMSRKEALLAAEKEVGPLDNDNIRVSYVWYAFSGGLVQLN